MSLPEQDSKILKVRRGILAAFSIIGHFPVLLPVGLITLFAEMTYSGVNNVSIPFYIPLLGVAQADEGRVIGAVISTFLLAETFLRVPFGWISDRFGRANVIIAAMVLSVPTITLSALIHAGQWRLLFPLRAWDGMMAAALWPSVYALVGDTIPGRLRANAMGVINMMYMLALFAGSGVATAIFNANHNPRLFFFIGAAAMAVGALAALIFFRLRPELNTPHPEVDEEDAERAIVKVIHHVSLLTITFTQNFAITLLAPFMIKYIMGPRPQNLGFNLPQLVTLVGIPVLGVGLLALPLSRLGDVWGKVVVVRVAFTSIALALWVFALSRNLGILALAAFVIAVTFAMGIPAWLAIISSLTNSKTRGVTLAGYGTVQGLASVLGPLVAGFIWDKVGHASIFMASAGLVTIAALLTWFTLPEHLHRHGQKQPGTV